MHTQRARKIGIICLLCLLVFSGCSWGPKKEKTAEELAAEGQKYFEKKSYMQAIKSYEKLRDWYPFSGYAKEAELKIADSHYRMKEYEEAILAYQEFEQLHPSDANAPYVIYQIGRCYFDRVDTIDRQQGTATNALKEFRRLQTRFPESDYAQKSEPHIQKCLTNLAGHEMYVGRFYFKSKHYEAALHRFMGVLSDYSGMGFDAEAADYVQRCRELIEKEVNAAEQREKEEKN